MFRVISCLTGEHDWRLVVLAGVVCCLASIAAMNLFQRARTTRGRSGAIWIGTAGAAAGCGIWATHFIAILAYNPGVGIGYGVSLTVLSLVVASLVTGIGLAIPTYCRAKWAAPLGGGIVGAGVACMHYLGMWALELPGHVTWSADLVAVSIGMGMALGSASLWTAARRPDVAGTLTAGLLLTLAIVSHHFTAMGAVEIAPDPTRTIDALSLSPTSLALAIANAAIAILGMSVAGALADKRAAERIAHMAHHDPLTGLPNRTAFNQRLASSLSDCAAARKSFYVLCIDLDRFKEVNDIFGHSAGDALLEQIGDKLRVVTDPGFVARLGGDEFTVLVSDEDGPAGVIAEKILSLFEQDFEVGGHSIRTGVSIGIAVYPNDGERASDLLSNADAALYRAKAEGRGTIRFFAPDMDQQLRDKRALQHELRTAVDREELALFYQPQASASGAITGFEALVRWPHRTRGMISPTIFIPLAEESSLIMTIGEWVLRRSCKEAASWPEPLQIAVNLSPVQFQHGDLPGLVQSILLETGLSATRLELEITEGVLIGDFSRALSILRRLKSLGVKIAMDDFGTGYSSLSYLQSFPFDKIKIDRSFITNLSANSQSAAIVRAVIGLARGLKLPVVAEGVETIEQLDFLCREACNEVQGYFIGKPLPIAHYAGTVGRSAEAMPNRSAA